RPDGRRSSLTPTRERLRAIAVGTVLALLLLLHVAVRQAGTRLGELGAFRRLWSDEALATTALVDARTRGAAARRPPNPDSVAVCHRLIVERVDALRIRPWEFWRTIRPEPFIRERIHQEAAPFDDPGRALLLGLGFRALGGVSPYLVFWLAPLLGAPVLAWTIAELSRSGHGIAGVVFGSVLVLSPFVVEVLSLSRSPVGFYLVAWLVLIGFAAFAILGPPSARSMLLRSSLAGLVFGLCAFCRVGSLFLTPGIALAIAVGAHRTVTTRRVLLALACAVLFLAPSLVVRPERSHNRWQPLWEGLGDFDRTHANTWSDPLAEEWVRRQGAPGLWTAESENVFRADMVATIRAEPGWFAHILAQRLWATVSQHKLWPRSASDGLWMERSTSMNEGYMDKYYTYTQTVDFLGWGVHVVEVPIALMILPTFALIALRRGREAVVLVAAAAAVFVPVVISTASGQETQAFALVYFLGFAFTLEALWARARRSAATSRGTPEGR
ncbi:MAG TPA: hypothetical protein VGQ33_03905, partial [Vicinamibacteria bacterium]|nr:hypothetical protein [Vicinamibacteria bacterium]